jgi:septum formation protein
VVGEHRTKLILASRSPRRRELLAEAGYDFQIDPPASPDECGVCSREGPPALVARLALEKAADVAQRHHQGIVVACDTIAECQGQKLGKPLDEGQARQMLRLLSGREHRVYSGLCLWPRPRGVPRVEVDVTVLRMDPLDEASLEDYLASGQWEGKAGAFGYQDRLGWIHVLSGSESNVVGLPMERLARMLAELDGPPG